MMANSQTKSKPRFVAQGPDSFDPAINDVESWLARFNVFITIS